MSQQHIAILTLSVKAAVPLFPQRFVTGVGAVPTAGGGAIGVTRSYAAIGDLVATDVLGTTLVEAGGDIAADALIEVGEDGRAVTHDTGTPVARVAPGAGPAADGDVIEVFLIPN